MLAVDSSIAQIAKWDGRKIAEDLHPGEYFKVLLRSHRETGNADLYEIWRRICREAALLSQRRAARQPEISKELVEAELEAIDRVFTDVVRRLVTDANGVFTGELFGGPGGFRFGDTPIRWPGENSEALEVIKALAGAAYQVPRVRSNSFDTGIPRNAAMTILMPLYRQKSRIMTLLFGIEVQGKVSPDELDAIYRDNDVRPPLVSSLRDKHDPAAVTKAEDDRAMGTEHAPTPTAEALARAKAGKDAWTWEPSEQEWAAFARIHEKMHPDGPVDQPGPIFPFSPTIIEGSNETAGEVAVASTGALTQ